MGAIQRSPVEEHAEGLVPARRPYDDPPGRCAPELDMDVSDRVEGQRPKARPRPVLAPLAGEDQVLVRQEQGGTDPAQHDEERLARGVLRWLIMVLTGKVGFSCVVWALCAGQCGVSEWVVMWKGRERAGQVPSTARVSRSPRHC
jgi:hypothetical protein